MHLLKRISFIVCLTLTVFVLRGCGDEQTRPTCQADSCSGHGTCDDSGGGIVCECDPGWAGEACDSCDTGYQDYGDGECRPSDPCADDTACAAQNRVCTNDQGSPVCGDCLAGYHDEAGTCVADEECLATSCSGHGTCDDSSGVVTCACDANYTGDHCDACESGYVFFPPDSGTCVDDACDPDPCNIPNAVADGCVQTDVDVFECTCETGYDWDGAACVAECQDEDNDGYGTGAACAGADCDDNDADIFEGNPDVCDDKDNDCDPATADGSADPLNGAACDGSDSDLCEEGTYSCSGGVLVCSDNTGDDLDVCDGADNDCDPASADGDEDPQNGDPCDGADSDLCEDDTLACSGGSMQCSNTSGDDLDVCDGVDNDCDPASADGSEDPLVGAACDGADSDLCEEGTNSCSGGSLVCSDNTGDDLDVCDGADNDCDPASADGSEDPQAGQACDGADSDLCEEGTNTCSGGSLQCSDTTGDDLDVCDGADNDCDPASADGSEDPQAGQACDGPDSDLCNEGTYSCSGGSLVCSDNTGSTVDICDGTDNDCDPASADGSEDPRNGDPCDGPDGDLCNEGTYSCSGGTLVCSDNTGDTLEICDGADNDCDGSTDEGCSCTNGQTRSCGTDVGECQTGIQTCSGGAWGACVGEITPAPEACNGLDDDCDGPVDEDLTLSCGTDVGECQTGIQTCSGGAWGACVGEITSAPEACNGLDDDCDGATDEDFPNLAALCSVGTGICEAVGIYVCRADGTGTECNAQMGIPTIEACNGLDDDCDGATDEDFSNLATLCSVGTGICQAVGIYVCRADGTGTECNAQTGTPTIEECNGLDDDCDGPVDEDLTQSCGTDVGECQTGIQTCSGGAWGACVGEITSAPEACNGLDDDCDGATDEDFPNLAALCSVGTGICEAVGIYVCRADGTGTECNAQPGVPTVEACNGLDDDCDGATDEDFPNLASPCSVGIGICQAAGIYVCKADGTGTECNAQPGIPTIEECNGLDDDCDGETDDQLTIRSCQVTVGGVGTCTGMETCDGVNGWVNCDAPTPTLEVCDYIDNECDGITDEDFRDSNGEYTLYEHCGACNQSCEGAVPHALTTYCDLYGGSAICHASSCEAGYVVDGPICVPVGGGMDCDPCLDNSDCDSLPDGQCELIDGDLFCTRSCTSGPDCDSGYDCVSNRCYPQTGSCSCNEPAHDGSTRICEVSNAWGTCSGTETCDYTSGWGPCSALTPAEEICDGVDNDCDGDTDEDFVCQVCGDGSVEGTETCDDSNDLSCGTCNATCNGPGDGPTCPTGTGCMSGGDCASGVCTANVCE